MNTMDNLKLKIKELELKIEELEALIDHIQDSSQPQLDHDDVRALVNQILADKEVVAAADLEKRLSQNQIQLIKWIVGTGISIISITFAMIQFLM
jgi:hypothetical protein